MEYLPMWETLSCGCVKQRINFRDSMSNAINGWSVITQCASHKDESEAIVRWFNEGAPGWNGNDDE